MKTFNFFINKIENKQQNDRWRLGNTVERNKELKSKAMNEERSAPANYTCLA